MLPQVRKIGRPEADPRARQNLHGQEMTRQCLFIAIALLFSMAAHAQESPFDFLVQTRIDGAPLGYGDLEVMRRNDWGPQGVPLGYVASENAMLWAGSAVQTWSWGYQPGRFNQAAGDGGQIITVSGTKAVFWSTQDGSYNGMQYIVGPVCGGDGWLLFDTANQINSVWTSKAAYLSISKVSATDCPPLAPAYTRWMRGLINYPFQRSGEPIGTVTLDTILTEHYDHDTPDGSIAMERNWFVKGMGNIRWEAWSKTAPPRGGLSEEVCPTVTLAGYYTPEFAGWHIIDCRYWTNFVPAQPGFTLSVYGWPFGR